MKCPRCGHENREDDRFCVSCGEPLPEKPEEVKNPAGPEDPVGRETPERPEDPERADGPRNEYVPAGTWEPVPPRQPRAALGLKAVLAVFLYVGLLFLCQSCTVSGFISASLLRSGAAGAAAGGMDFLTQEYVNELVGSVYDNMVMILFISGLVTILVLCLFFRLRRRVPAEEFTLHFANPVRLLQFALLGTALNVLVSVTFSYLPLPESLTEALNDQYASLFGQNIVVEILATAVLMPVVEEIIFRGLGMTRLYPVFGGAGAAILTAVIFGLAHGTPLAIAYAALLGLLLAAVWLRYGTILPGIFLHCFFNLTTYWLSAVENTAVLSVLYVVSIALTILLLRSALFGYPVFEDLLFDPAGRIRVKDPEKQAILTELRLLRDHTTVTAEEVEALRDRWNALGPKKKKSRRAEEDADENQENGNPKGE